MSNFRFSQNSKDHLKTCHSDLRAIFNLALDRSIIDFGITCGHRPVSKQQELYASGRTKEGPILTYVDGVNKKGKHNFKPSQAVDIVAYVHGKVTWELKYYTFLGGVIMAIGMELYECEEVDHRLRWGGDFDRDGDIIEKGSFIDLPHFELIV